MAIAPYGAPVPLANFHACVIPLTKANQVCVCSHVVNRSGWKAMDFFCGSFQAVSAPLLGSPPSCESCCKDSGRRWEEAVINGEAKIELIKKFRQCYHQVWKQDLMPCVLQRNEGSHNSVQTSAALQTSGNHVQDTLRPNPSHSCYIQWSQHIYDFRKGSSHDVRER